MIEKNGALIKARVKGMNCEQNDHAQQHFWLLAKEKNQEMQLLNRCCFKHEKHATIKETLFQAWKTMSQKDKFSCCDRDDKQEDSQIVPDLKMQLRAILDDKCHEFQWNVIDNISNIIETSCFETLHFFTNENQRCLMIKVHCTFRDDISDQTFRHWKHTDEDKVQEVNLFQTLERKMDFEV